MVTLSEYHKAYYQKCGLRNVEVIYNGRDVNCDTDIEDSSEQAIMNLKQKYRIIRRAAYNQKERICAINRCLEETALICTFDTVGDGPHLSELRGRHGKMG